MVSMVKMEAALKGEGERSGGTWESGGYLEEKEAAEVLVGSPSDGNKFLGDLSGHPATSKQVLKLMEMLHFLRQHLFPLPPAVFITQSGCLLKLLLVCSGIQGSKVKYKVCEVLFFSHFIPDFGHFWPNLKPHKKGPIISQNTQIIVGTWRLTLAIYSVWCFQCFPLYCMIKKRRKK